MGCRWRGGRAEPLTPAPLFVQQTETWLPFFSLMGILIVRDANLPPTMALDLLPRR